MGIEIERKFLLRDERWRDAPGISSKPYRQGYLLRDSGKTIRVRVAGDKGYITIKGKTTSIARPEYEYEIPLKDAEELFAFCQGQIIEKTRYRIPYGKHVWEVDEFSGDNAGLVVAEIELNAEDEAFEKPEWVGEEVSTDRRYTNAALSNNPWRNW